MIIAGGFLYGLVVTGGCASTPLSDELLAAPPAALHTPAELTNVPFFAQSKYQCGPAALAMALAASGVDILPAQLVDDVYIPERRGSLQTEMVATARRHGRIPYLLEQSLADVLREVRDGRPVLVFQNLGIDWYPQWHYAVVTGFDLDARNLILHSGTTRRRMVAMEVFERTWARADYWAVVLVKPGELPATAKPDRYFQSVVAYEGTAGPDESALAYGAGLARWPQHAALSMGYANLHYALGRLRAAAETLVQLLDSHPDYAPAHNNLATIYLEMGRLEQAENHARRAIELGGRHSRTYRRTLTEILDGYP